MKRAYTLIEMLVVVIIVTILFAAILSVMVSSNLSWRQGQDSIIEQSQARMAMDRIVTSLRQSSAGWVLGNSTYGVTISDNNSRIDYYTPVFDIQGQIIQLEKVTVKLNPGNPEQLLLKEGTLNQIVIGNNMQSIQFGGGCPGCTTYTCSTVANDCPVVAISLTTTKRNSFTLSTQLKLRNRNPSLNGSIVTVEEPVAGEF